MKIVSGIWYLVFGIGKNAKYNIQNTKYRKAEGFTLIELLVVISIIGILTSIGTISYFDAQKRGRDARRIRDLEEIRKGLQLYYNDHGTYPPVEWVHSTAGSSWIPGLSPQYMKSIPVDPVNKDPNGQSAACFTITADCRVYGYYGGAWCNLNTTSQYILTARLEGSTDASHSQRPYLNEDGSVCSDWWTSSTPGLYVVGE